MGWKGLTGLGRVPEIHGAVAPGWEGVKAAFEENFRSRNDIGSALCVFYRGEKVVDLWGGESHDDGTEWREDTLVNIFSTTKGLSALCLLILQSRGLLEWDAPVARYWPEFAQKGKEAITVRQLMAHEAGLAPISRPLTVKDLADWRVVGEALAETASEWEPGTKHGYMALTLGWYIDQLVRRCDPAGRSVSQLIQEDVVPAVGLPGEFFLGLPPAAELDRRRLAHFDWPSTKELLRYGLLGGRMVWNFTKAMLFDKSSYTHRAFKNPKCLGDANIYNTEEIRALEIPASNGHSTARFVAACYNGFVSAELGLENPLKLSEAALAEMREPTGKVRFDETFLCDTRFSHGFWRPQPELSFGSTDAAFGCGGIGGSIGFADAAAGIAYGFVPRGGNIFRVDPRDLALRQAIYAVVASKGGAVRPQLPDKQLAAWLSRPDDLFYRSTLASRLRRRMAGMCCPCSARGPSRGASARAKQLEDTTESTSVA